MSSMDPTAADRMVAQVSEYTNTERRFRRYRCLMVAFFVTLMLSLIVYLLLTWELSEEPQERSNDSVTFTTILVISVSALAIVSVTSFVSLECIRRKSIRQLIAMQNDEMRDYYEGGRTRHISNQGSIQGINPSEIIEGMQMQERMASRPRRHRSNQVSQPSSSISGQSSWIVPPGSEASSPPPAYDECIV